MASYTVTTIPLLEVIQHYFSYTPSDFTKQGKNIYLAKCPIHKEKRGTSLSIYDKTETGGGWDWFCFGACQKGGTAPKLLVDAGLFPTMEEAVEDLRKTFKLTFPDLVTLEAFAEAKGLSIDFLSSRGCSYQEVEVKRDKGTVSLKGVVIPFYDRSGKPIAKKIRLKFTGTPKYAFLEGKNTVYGLDLLDSFTTEYIYICEGETDALTLLQAGFQAVGIPGAAAWQSSWADYFHKFKKIIVLSDNDTAGHNLLLNLATAFPKNLYTVQLPRNINDINDFFVYNFGANLDNFQQFFREAKVIPATPEAFKLELQQNPELLSSTACWRNALACIGTNEVKQLLFVEELKNALPITKSLIVKAYREAIKGQAALKSTEKKDYNIFIRDNCYYRKVLTESGYEEIKLSNFVMHLIHTIESDGDHVRICRLVNEQGQTSRLVQFDSDTLTKPLEFMSECKKAGNYIFKGEFRDLISLNELLLDQETNIIHSPDHIGRIGKAWLMGRYGVDSTGNVVEADKDGIIELDGESYMVRSLNVVDANDATYLPVLPEPYDITPEYLQDVARTLKANLGGFEAWLALGFTVAGWHSREIYLAKGDKAYPIFFISGKRNSGKTYLARWLMSAYGFPHIEGKSFSLPSIVSMTRKLGYYSSLPQWYGDYRNNIKDIKFRNEFMLGVYNKQGADKGTRLGFGVRNEPIRGFLLLDGEDTPQDNAVLSRCTVIQVSAYQRDDTLLNRMLDLVRYFPAMGLHFLQKKQREGSDELLSQIFKIQEELEQAGIDARLAKNTAVFAGSFLYGFGKYLTQEEIEEFMAWLRLRTEETKEITESEHSVAQFFSDMTVMMADGKVQQGHHFFVADGYIYLWFKACYDAWRQEYRDVVQRAVLAAYFDKEPFCVKRNHPYRMSAQVGVVKTTVLDYKLIPDEDFRSFCEALDEEEEF